MANQISRLVSSGIRATVLDAKSSEVEEEQNDSESEAVYTCDFHLRDRRQIDFVHRWGEGVGL